MIILYLLFIIPFTLGENFCCPTKEVLDGSLKGVYAFKEERPGIAGCIDDCVYTRDGEDYCFSSENSYPVNCIDEVVGTPSINCTEDNDKEDLFCIPGVRRFAAKCPEYFYECKAEDVFAKLTKCPEGKIFIGDSLLCHDTSNSGPGTPLFSKRGNVRAGETNGEDESKILFEPVLGRSVRLGDLYDSRRHLPLNGLSLWDMDQIKESKFVKKKKLYSNTNFFVEKDQSDRLSHFNVDAHLSLSFLGGLIKVDGSAHYLKDEHNFHKFVRISMLYDATTRTETLPMALRENVTYKSICDNFLNNPKAGPTHVITSVEYGMKAVFVFENEVSSHKDVQEIGGSLHVLVESIPGFKLDGSAKLDLTEKEKKITDSTKVKLFGDFILDKSPTTFEAAVKVYQTMPSHLGDETLDYEKSSPMNFMLTPIGQICKKKEPQLAGISANLLTVATQMMANLDKLSVYIKSLESTFLAHQFVDVSTMLGLFRTKLTVETIEVKTKFSQILPEIRGGTNNAESHLVQLLGEYFNSPFQYDKGRRFLEERERELNTINYLFDDKSIVNGNIEIADFTSANVAGALIQTTYVLIYKFNVFSHISVTKEYLENQTFPEDAWYNSNKLIGEMGYTWRKFSDFAVRNALFSQDQTIFIQGDAYIQNKLSEIYLYKNGLECTSNFKVPFQPPKPKVVTRTYKSVTLHLGNIEDIKNQFVTEILVKYKFVYLVEGAAVIEESNYQKVTVPVCPEVISVVNSCIDTCTDGSGPILTTIDISLEKNISLTANKTAILPVTYSFITAFKTPVGYGPDSDRLENVRANACNFGNSRSIYLMFGGVSDQVPQEEIYNPNKDIACSKPLPKIPEQYLFIEHVTFVHNSMVYLCGGLSENTRSICISHDLSDDSNDCGWKTYDNHKFGRRFHASIVMQNRVYMIGGASIVGPHNIWSPLPLQDPPVFKEVPNLKYFGGMGICLVKLNEDSFIAMGGWGTFTDVKKYTISAQTTTVLPSLPGSRTWPGCEKVEKHGKVWIVIGRGHVVAESARLDLENGREWEPIGNLNVPRYKSELVSTEYGLMMLGSAEGINSVEVLDWNTKQWNLYEPSLQYQRGTLEATVQVPTDLLKCRKQ